MKKPHVNKAAVSLFPSLPERACAVILMCLWQFNWISRPLIKSLQLFSPRRAQTFFSTFFKTLLGSPSMTHFWDGRENKEEPSTIQEKKKVNFVGKSIWNFFAFPPSLPYPKRSRLFFSFSKLPSSGIGKERDWECWCGLASDAWLAPSVNYMCNELFIWDNAQQERLPNTGAGSRPRESQG